MANVFSGIENLAEKCRDSYKINPPKIDEMSNIEKLELIKVRF